MFYVDDDNLDTCRQACAADGRCKAYTYARAGLFDARGKCHLKSETRPLSYPSIAAQLVSGVRRGLENRIDRRGYDYQFIDGKNLDYCVAACSRDSRYQAFTVVPPSFWGNTNALCYLKSAAGKPCKVIGLVSGLRGMDFF